MPGTPGVEPTPTAGGGGAGAGYWGAAAQLIGTAADIYFTNKMNQQQQAYNREMYGISREDALADWNRQNAYNDPSAQMARLKAAGLNPNLVYGTGAVANSAAPTRAGDIKGYQPTKLPVADAAKAIDSYQNLSLGQEQVRLLQQQIKNMQVDHDLKTMDIATKGIKTAQSQFDLDQARALNDTVIAKANAQVRATEVGTDVKIAKNVRDEALQAPKLATAFQNVANSELKGKMTESQIALAKAQLQKYQREGILDDMEISIRKLGMSYQDPLWARMLAQFADGKPLPEVIKSGWDAIHKAVNGWIPKMPFSSDREEKRDFIDVYHPGLRDSLRRKYGR